MQVETDSSATVATVDQWRNTLEALAARAGPTFAKLRAQLPQQGRTDQMLAASDRMTVVLKTYANGGENALHAHSNEDHVFVVMQGGATFYGPQGEQRHAQRHECVFLPRGSLYWFAADEGGEALVMLRIGAVVDATADVLARVDAEGRPFAGEDPGNKPVPLVLSDNWFE